MSRTLRAYLAVGGVVSTLTRVGPSLSQGEYWLALVGLTCVGVVVYLWLGEEAPRPVRRPRLPYRYVLPVPARLRLRAGRYVP